MGDLSPPRLSGTIWKRNAGILRPWRSRSAAVTAEGFLLYKKKASGVKTKEIDLVKTTFTATISQANGYYYFELQYGPTQVAIGFPELQSARQWQSCMMEAADENSGGRRAWVKNLRRMLTLKLRDRRELVPAMADRDWFSEWNFCLRSLKNDQEPITARQRRLRRLHTIWLQFELFAEVLAEIFFSSVQQRDASGLARIESFERAASDIALNGGSDHRSHLSRTVGANPASVPSRISSMSTASLSSTLVEACNNDSGDNTGGDTSTRRRDDVDEMKLAGIHLEFASKSWQGHKRLAKETARFAKFRALIELFLFESISENGKFSESMRAVLSKLPTFPLVSSFSIRGVRVMAIAEPLRGERLTTATLDNRDLAGLSMALREAKMLRYFPYQELPELIVRKFPGTVAPTLVRVHPRYDDVLVNSLRSSMVHGVLIRAVHTMSDSTSRLEVLSAHDVEELVLNKKPEWIPYLDLVYYQLNKHASPVENLAASDFLLKAGSHTINRPLTGDVIITVDPEKSKLLLGLPEAFVRKHDIEIHPLVQKLQSIKKNSAIFALATSSPSYTQSPGGQSRPVDTSLMLAREYEDEVKKLFVQHIKEFAAQLVTLGDAPETKAAGFDVTGRPRAPTWQSSGVASRSQLTRSNTMSAMPRREDVFTKSSSSSSLQNDEIEYTSQPPLRRRMSSLGSMAQALGRGGLSDSNAGTYVIDTLHLRQAMQEGGVNMRFLPLVFQYLSNRDQLGVKVLVASEIIARLAKNLFRYRMLNEDTGKISRWKSRKVRLIKFIDSIMHGLFHKSFPDGQCSIRECSGDHFWEIDGPIMYSLGAFSSSFAMDSRTQTEVANSASSCLDKYRDLLKVNPVILFTSLMHVFQARLTKSILPGLHENQFVSVPFLRNEDDLTFHYEEDDPKLALKIDQDLLWSHLQFFRLQFESLKPELPQLNVGGQENSGSKYGVRTERTTWTRYYRVLSQIFRQSVSCSQPTRLEKAIYSWEDLTAVRAHLSLALRAAAAPSYLPSSNNRSTTAIREHCRFAFERMATSKALFPIEFKLALRCLELVSTGEELAKAMENCQELLEWLRFFYRPANPSQFAKGSSSHPVYSLQFSQAAEFLDDHDQGLPLFSLRESFQRQQLRQSWMSIMSNVDAYCRRIEVMKRNPVDIAATRAVLCEMEHLAHVPASLSPSSMGSGDNSSFASVESGVSYADNHHSPFSLHLGESSMPSSRIYSSRGDALWFIECFFLPPLANNSLVVAGDALMNNSEISSRMTSIRSGVNEGPVPGLALSWGKSFGMSLDDEARINNGTCAASLSLRPSTKSVSLVSMISFPPPLRRVVQVACGYRHTALVTDDRHLYTFGYGECGRLGHGTEDSCMEPKPVGYFASLVEAEGVELGGVVDVACGREHTMAVTLSGDLFGFGWGEAGRLGTGETGSSLYPSRVTSLKDVARVACGREHTLALTRAGQVFAFGAGFGGRLGNDAETDEELPFAVGGMESYVIAAIDAGECHSCALSDKGDVFTWGFGSSGALGHGTRDNCLRPQRIDGPWACIDDLGQSGKPHPTEVTFVTYIACGSYHTLAATDDGTLYGWGDSAAGQLGVELVSAQDMVVLSPTKLRVPTSSGLRSIACGTFTSAVCTQQGQVFLWGSPAAGNGAPLDIEDARIKRIGVLGEFEFSQIACGAYHAVALTKKLEYC